MLFRSGEVGGNFQHAQSLHASAASSEQQFNDDFDAQMFSLNDTLSAPLSIDDLKTGIHQQLKSLSARFMAFREQGSLHQQDMQAQLAEMTERVQVMETEACDLRDRIREEHERATIDPVTRINNRLAYEQRVAEEFAHWKRYKKPLTLAMWDIDYFKRINDEYGHTAGDKVLRIVANLLARKIRDCDYVARFGGEEFVMIFPQTELMEAFRVSDRLREHIEVSGFHYRDKPVNITICCGLSEFTPEDSIEDVLIRADKAL